MTKSSVITNPLLITITGLIIDYLFSSDCQMYKILNYSNINLSFVQGIGRRLLGGIEGVKLKSPITGGKCLKRVCLYVT